MKTTTKILIQDRINQASAEIKRLEFELSNAIQLVNSFNTRLTTERKIHADLSADLEQL